MIRWLSLDWYHYLFAPINKHYSGWLNTLRCRIKGHPRGEVFYNPGALEPNHHCVGCGDEIG